MVKKIFILVALLLIVPFISAELFPEPSVQVGVGFGDVTGQTGVNVVIPDPVLNVSSANVNHSQTSDYATMAGDSLLFNGYSIFNYINGYIRGETLVCFLSGGVDCTMSGDILMGGNDINNVNNLSVNNNVLVGQTLTVEDSIVIKDRLYVGILPNESQTTTSPGDAVFTGTVTANDSIISFPRQFSPSLVGFNSGDNSISENPIFISSTGLIDSETRTFCDMDNSPFVESSLGRLLLTLVNSPFGGSSLVMEITEVINSSCVQLSFAIFGEASVSDINVFVYVIAPDPVISAFDNGFVLSSIGTSSDANFKINALNASGAGKFQVNTISNDNSVNAVLINSDQKDFHGLSNIISNIFSSVNSSNILVTNTIISADLLNQNGGEYIGSEYSLLNSGENITTTAIEASADFTNIISIVQTRTLSSAVYDNTVSLQDITSDINNPTTTTQLFTEVDGTLYIGDGGNFTKILFNLATESSDNIQSEFYYCNDGGTYSLINVSDTTGGFTSSGSVSIINPIDRGECNTNIEGEPMPNSTNFTYIAIRRKASVIATPPVLLESTVLSTSSRFIIGNDGFIEAETAMGFINEEFQEQGSITHYFESKDKIGQPLIKLVAVSGKNESSSLLGNSWGLVPEYMGIENFSVNNKVNLMASTSYITLCSMFGVDCSFNADTRGNAIDLIPGGPLLWTMGDSEIWQSLKVHMGISVDGPAIFNLEGNDADFNNGSIHPSKAVTFQQGFIEGDEVVKFVEQFSSNLGIFTNLQSDLGNWVSVLSPTLCADGQCARGDGSGSGYVEMQTNVSTLDINETRLSFIYSLFNLIGAGEFSIVVNNNIGSGDIEIFSDTTDNVINSPESIALPASMNNQTLISISIICNVASASKPTRQCYSDTVKLNGTAISTTIINVSSFDSEICGGDGSRDAEGNCNIGIRWDAKTAQWIFGGTINATGTITGGISGSGTANNIPRFNSPTSLTNSQIIDNGTLITLGLPTLMQGNTISPNYNATYDNIFTNSGFTGNCINTSFVSGIAIGCND